MYKNKAKFLYQSKISLYKKHRLVIEFLILINVIGNYLW